MLNNVNYLVVIDYTTVLQDVTIKINWLKSTWDLYYFFYNCIIFKFQLKSMFVTENFRILQDSISVISSEETWKGSVGEMRKREVRALRNYAMEEITEREIMDSMTSFLEC